jgi:hypothetical protein
MIRSLCPDPTTKFLTNTHTYSATPSHTWHQITTHLLQHGSSNLWKWTEADKTKARTSALACIIRGSPPSVERYVPDLGQLETKLRKAYNTVSWNPFPVDYWVSYEPKMGHTKMGTVWANSSVVLDYVGAVYNRAGAMFSEGAYLHWYQRFGCEKDTFKQALECMQGVMDTYREM